MALLLRRLSRLPNYIKAFGLLHGLRLLLAIERSLPGQSEHARAFNVPGYQAPIWLRDCLADHAIFWQCIVQRQYDISRLPHHAAFLRRYNALVAAGEAPLIIDAGGNVGLSAIALAEAYPQARILVVEPDAANFAMLRRNVEPYGSRIMALFGAVWPREQLLSIVNPADGASAFRVDHAEHGGVKAHTMDALMKLAGADSIFLAKIDIEGAQKPLFAENTDWIARTDAIVIELEDWLLPWQGNSAPFFRAMAPHDVEYLLLGDSIVCFSARLGEPDEATGQV